MRPDDVLYRAMPTGMQTTQVPRTMGHATLEPMTTAADRDPFVPEPTDAGSRPAPAGQWDEPDDTTGSYALEARGALRRVAGLSTELADVTEVEYRRLRLERVVLVGVWTEGTQADADQSLAELAALAETAGSQVLEAVSQRRDKPDAATYVG
jgi:GTP-binding protein HflX